MNVLFTWETPLVKPWPPVHLFTLITTLFITITPLVHFYIFIYFTIQLTALFSTRPERLTTFSPLGAKYLVECVKVRICWGLRVIDFQHSPRCWFQSPTGSINLGSLTRENCCLLHLRLRLGHQPTLLVAIKLFSGAIAGDLGSTARGVSHSQSLYFIFVLFVLFLVSYFFCCKILKPKKN